MWGKNLQQSTCRNFVVLFLIFKTDEYHNISRYVTHQYFTCFDIPSDAEDKNFAAL